MSIVREELLLLDLFARALRLRWPWQEWTVPEKVWVGMGKTCSKNDMNLFYAASSIIIGDAPWLIDIAPHIFMLCKNFFLECGRRPSCALMCLHFVWKVWNAWTPPKYKFFACLVIQTRVWTADHLQHRGLTQLWGLPVMQANFGIGGALVISLPVLLTHLEYHLHLAQLLEDLTDHLGEHGECRRLLDRCYRLPECPT